MARPVKESLQRLCETVSGICALALFAGGVRIQFDARSVESVVRFLVAKSQLAGANYGERGDEPIGGSIQSVACFGACFGHPLIMTMAAMTCQAQERAENREERAASGASVPVADGCDGYNSLTNATTPTAAITAR